MPGGRNCCPGRGMEAMVGGTAPEGLRAGAGGTLPGLDAGDTPRTRKAE